MVLSFLLLSRLSDFWESMAALSAAMQMPKRESAVRCIWWAVGMVSALCGTAVRAAKRASMPRTTL